VLNRHAHVDKTKYDQDGALRRYVVYERPSLLVYKWVPVLTQSSRWKLDEMREDAKRRGVTPPDERIAREHCLSKGVEAPDLAAVKDFLRYDLSVAHDLLRNSRVFIRLRLGRTRSDYKRRDGFRNDRLLAVSNRRKVAEEVIVVKNHRLMLRLRALRVT
jgi:hypothetical protein